MVWQGGESEGGGGRRRRRRGRGQQFFSGLVGRFGFSKVLICAQTGLRSHHNLYLQAESNASSFSVMTVTKYVF